MKHKRQKKHGILEIQWEFIQTVQKNNYNNNNNDLTKNLMLFLPRLHCHTALGDTPLKNKTLKWSKKYQDNWNQVKIMHKFGKMDRHLHATVPVPCNSKYSMLMSWWTLCSHRNNSVVQYIKIYWVSYVAKLNLSHFLFSVWRKRAGSTRTSLSCF